MPTNMYDVFIEIGNKNRRIHIGGVRAGNNKQAIDKLRQDIGAEFLGLKYTIEAEHTKPEEHMTEEKFEEMCYERAHEDTNDIEHQIDDIDDDKQVADFFGITFEVVWWDLEGNEVTEDDVKGICECEFPLTNEDLYVESEKYHDYDDDAYQECPSCGCDIRTPTQRVVSAI